MKGICVIWAIVLFAAGVEAQPFGYSTGVLRQHPGVSYAPLLLITNGGGGCVPFHDGDMLQVGRYYTMTAIPARGFVFAGWTPVNEFEYITDELASDGSVFAVTNIVDSPVATVVNHSQLRFVVSPPQLIYGDEKTRIIIERTGWQANFVRKPRFGSPH